ncbi:MAG: MoaD/ThiS family protein [Dehalococcoidia bacterium]|nr:MoaD/ThiS family protein [Dehalococcoidia bacterium]
MQLPSPLQTVVGGQRTIDADGDTVGAALRQLTARYPELADRLFGPDGEPHRFLNIYLNDEDIRFLGGLDAPVNHGDVVAILPALVGGGDAVP